MGRITASGKQLRGDPRHNSILATKFVNSMMWDGKKSTAFGIFYDALDEIKKKLPNEEPIEVFTQAVENVKPIIEVRSRRVGGASYQVPMQSIAIANNLLPFAGSCWRFVRRKGVQRT